MKREPLEKSYFRCFDSDEGREVLAHLQSITMGRVLSPDAADNMLWYLEGQRQLVRTIASLIERGKHV